MSPERVFQIQMPFAYLVWALAIGTWVWPRLKAVEPAAAQRAIATLHSFRFFGLVFLVPGGVGPGLPGAFAVPAAYGDLAAAVLATAALLAFRTRVVFWPLIVLFNIVGLADLVLDIVHAVQLRMPSFSGQLGAAYAIPFLYVPALFVTHIAAFALLLRRRPRRLATRPASRSA